MVGAGLWLGPWGPPRVRVGAQGDPGSSPPLRLAAEAPRGGCCPQLSSHAPLCLSIWLCVSSFLSHGSQHQHQNIFANNSLGYFLSIIQLQGHSD